VGQVIVPWPRQFAQADPKVLHRATALCLVLAVLLGAGTAHASLQPTPVRSMATTKPSSGNVQLRPESREPDDAANGNFTIYLRHLQVAVSTVLRERGDLRELFSPEEQALATLLLPQEGNGSDVLSREARGLYTRMLQRKGPWFRLESLIKYDELLSGRQEGGAALILLACMLPIDPWLKGCCPKLTCYSRRYLFCAVRSTGATNHIQSR
jgi:hypothetical protein